MIEDVAFSRDGGKIAAGGDDFNISVWDRNQPRSPLILQGHEGEVYSVAFSKDGNILVSGSRDGTVKLWDVSSFEPKTITWQFRDFMGQVVFSPDGKYLAGVSSGDQEQLKLWDVAANREIAKINLEESPPASASFSADGNLLVTCNRQRALVLRVPSLEVITNLTASTIAFSPKGNFLILVREGQVIRRDAASGSEMVLGTLPEGNSWRSIVSPDGRKAAIEVDDPVPIITLWDTFRPAPPILLRGHTQYKIPGLAFSADSRLFASAGWDGLVGLWDAQNGRKIGLFRAHTGEAWGVAFSPEGNALVSSGDDNAIKFWNLATLQEAASLHGHKGVISTIAFSPDGSHLASGGNRMVRIWDAPTFEEIAQKEKERK